MNRRAIVYSLVVAAVTATLGCGPPWQVVKQAAPNPFLGKKAFGALPMDYTGMEIGGKTEAEYVADKDADSRQKWEGDKGAIAGNYVGQLIGKASEAGIQVTPGPGEFIVKPRTVFVEPGIYTAIYNKASQLRVNVQVTDAQGAVLDEFIVKSATAADFGNISSGQRLRKDAENVGRYSGMYLQSRVSPKKD